MATLTVADVPLTTEMPAQRLRRTAAAVRVHFTWWGVHRTLTTQQKEEVGLTYGADSRFVTAGKKLVDTRHEAFRRLTSIRSRAVSYWKGQSLPYVEPGVRLIRQSDVEAFVHTMEGFRDELSEAERELDAVYEEVRHDARERLGRLYSADDYPPEVRGLFKVEWDFPAVEPPTYLMRLNPDLYRQEQDRVTRRFEEAVQLAEQAFLGEFSKLIAHLAERLGGQEDGRPKVFRDSAVTNLRDFFDKFKALNVGSSRELDQLVEQAQNLVRGISPQELRDKEDLRVRVATEMGQVQARLDALTVDRPRRQIIRATPSRNGEGHAAAD